jgi:hypothetical protein
MNKNSGKNRLIRNINNDNIKEENNRAGILNPITTPITDSKDNFLDNMYEALLECKYIKIKIYFNQIK